MIAPGPTLTPDGNKHTGSLHIIDLTAAEDTDAFAYQEPFYKAGVYEEVMYQAVWKTCLADDVEL